MTPYWKAPHGLHVTLGEEEDAPALARLHAEAFYRGWAEEEFAAYLADRKQTPVYVATDRRRRILGFAVYKIVLGEAELLTIAVERRWRHKGIATALMRASRDDLEHARVRKIFLEVEDGNRNAIGLYHAFDFWEIARRQGYYTKPDGAKATALVMRCDLS